MTIIDVNSKLTENRLYACAVERHIQTVSCNLKRFTVSVMMQNRGR